MSKDLERILAQKTRKTWADVIQDYTDALPDEPETLRYEIKSDGPWALTPDTWKALNQADPIVAGSRNASIKGRIDSLIQCRRHNHEKHLEQWASIDSLHIGFDEPEILRRSNP